jgi:hypothetical protein
VVTRPTVQVKNFGTESEAFEVFFDISDGYSAQTTLVLPAGATTEVRFDDWTPGRPGTYAKRGWVVLAGDENPRNDTATGQVTVIPRTGVEELALPAGFAVSGLRPNPTSGRTTVSLSLPRRAPTRLEVYSASGALVRGLLDAELAAGSHELVWDGCGSDGRPVSRGAYFVRLEADGRFVLAKLTVTR